MLPNFIIFYFSYRRGRVYKKVEEGTHTYIDASSIERYLNVLCGNSDVRSILIPVLGTLETRLSNVDFCGIPQIELRYDLVEVLPQGWFFNIPERRFQQHALTSEDVGKVSPRTWIGYKYTPGDIPYPKRLVITNLQFFYSINDTITII